MNSTQPARPEATDERLRWFLHEKLPEIRHEIGHVIDRENSRPLPDGYADLLLDTVLVVLLDAPIADAATPVMDRLKSDLARAAYIHGSMYDREYAVELRSSDLPGSLAFRVLTRSGYRRTVVDSDSAAVSAEATPADDDRTIQFIPFDGLDTGPIEESSWDSGRWVVRAEFVDGSDRLAFRLASPLTTVGRSTDDDDYAVDIALDLASKSISRRQLALEWCPDVDGAVAFRVYNLGLAPILVGGSEVSGADSGKGELELTRIAAEHSARCEPGVEILVGSPELAIVIEELVEAEDTEKTQVY